MSTTAGITPTIPLNRTATSTNSTCCTIMCTRGCASRLGIVDRPLLAAASAAAIAKAVMLL